MISSRTKKYKNNKAQDVSSYMLLDIILQDFIVAPVLEPRGLEML